MSAVPCGCGSFSWYGWELKTTECLGREYTKGCLGSKGAWKITHLSPWSYPDAAATDAVADTASAASSAAASAVCILSCTYMGARSAPP